MPLNNKQELFISEYLIDFNATQAAIRAGYSKKTAYSQGNRLLKKAEVSREIEARLDHVAMTADEILTRLSDMAQASLSDFIDIRNGLPFVDLEKAQQNGKMHLLKKFRHKIGEEIQIELHDAQTALVNLARIHGMLIEKQQTEHTGELTVKIIYEDTLGSDD